jgi:hypothetical protein
METYGKKLCMKVMEVALFFQTLGSLFFERSKLMYIIFPITYVHNFLG